MEFKVYKIGEGEPEDVTDTQEWYIDIQDGTLCYLTNDIDAPLYEASVEYYYEVRIKALE